MSELSVPLRPACLKEGHPRLPSSPLPPVSHLIPLTRPIPLFPQHPHHPPPLLHSPQLPPSSSHSHSVQAGLRGWCADLVIQIRATLSAQGPSLSLSLSLIACPGSFFPTVTLPPAAREDLIKQHSFSSTSVNSNAVTQITVGGVASEEEES